MSRREWWEAHPWRISPLHRHETDDDPLEAAWQERVRNPKRERESIEFTAGELIRSSKEIIYCYEEGKPGFLHITYGLDFGTAEMTVGPTLMSVDIDEEHILRTIGLAHAYATPIVPDVPELEPELRAYERQALSGGFPLPDGGETTWVRNSRVTPFDLESADAIELLSGAEPIMPSEVRVVVESVRRELESLTEASRVLGALRLAIDELEAALEATSANESDLQRVLTRHPVLFGPEYSRIKPKHRLGGDFEMDFALVRMSGFVDLVEIEASTRPLFNRRGDPAAPLVHAEQQVLDWLAWLEDAGQFARRDLAELRQPTGYVVIGRDAGLVGDQRQRLVQRNAVFAGSLHILTYDGLLARARNLIATLSGVEG